MTITEQIPHEAYIFHVYSDLFDNCVLLPLFYFFKSMLFCLAI